MAHFYNHEELESIGRYVIVNGSLSMAKKHFNRSKDYVGQAFALWRMTKGVETPPYPPFSKHVVSLYKHLYPEAGLICTLQSTVQQEIVNSISKIFEQALQMPDVLDKNFIQSFKKFLDAWSKESEKK